MASSGRTQSSATLSARPIDSNLEAWYLILEMKTTFVARSAEEAERIFGSTFYAESRPATQPELDERVQLGALLRTYALSESCQFPIEVYIPPREQRPDFKVTFGRSTIGIEASKIANSELEEVRTAQRQDKLGTIEISSLLQRQSRTSRNRRIVACIANPVFVFPDSKQQENEDDFWLDQAQFIIKRKHTITKQPTFNRYGQCWLLLWDKLSYEDELDRRVVMLADKLVHTWGNDFFEKIIIQRQHSERFCLLSSQGIEKLQKPEISPVAEFNITADDSLGIK